MRNARLFFLRLSLPSDLLLLLLLRLLPHTLTLALLPVPPTQVFAVDSIPAVFGVTTDPFIAFTSNAFALLGLRSLYTLIANAVDDFVYLRPSIAIVLGFIGGKLVGEFAGYGISTEASLLIVLSVLGGGVGLSVFKGASGETEQPQQQPQEPRTIPRGGGRRG
jgi:hypothetical protein